MEADAGKQLKPEKSGLVTVGSLHLHSGQPGIGLLVRPCPVLSSDPLLDTARETRAMKHESHTSPCLWLSRIANQGRVGAPAFQSPSK